MSFTFHGTYTKNDGDAPAAGTVEVFTRAGVSLGSATLDATGSYSLVIDAQEGEMKVVETMTGVAARNFPVGVSRGSVTDTSRDIGRVAAVPSSPADHDHSGAYVAGGEGIEAIVALTQAAYDALDPPDAETLYVIVEA